MKAQVRAASRKWFARAMMFFKLSETRGPNVADQYLSRFRRKDKMADALVLVQTAKGGMIL